MIVYRKNESNVEKNNLAEEWPKSLAAKNTPVQVWPTTHEIRIRYDATGAETNLGQGQEVRIANGMASALASSSGLVGRRQQIPHVSISARASSAAANVCSGSLDQRNGTSQGATGKIYFGSGKTETLGFEPRSEVSVIPPIGACRGGMSPRDRVFDATDSNSDQQKRQHPSDDVRDSVAIYSPYHDKTAYVFSKKHIRPDWHIVSIGDYNKAARSICSVEDCPCNHILSILSHYPMAIVSDAENIVGVILVDSAWKKFEKR